MRWILIGTIWMILLSSCANVLRFEKENLVAFGEKLDKSPEHLFYLVRVDMAKSIDNELNNFNLKLSSDGPPIALNKLTPELVAKYLHPFIPPPQWPDRMKEKIKGQDIYAENGFQINFKNGQLIYINICSHCAGGNESPVVGTPDGNHFYTLPLTEQQVFEVFGSPNRVYKVNEVRY